MINMIVKSENISNRSGVHSNQYGIRTDELIVMGDNTKTRLCWQNTPGFHFRDKCN